MVWCESPVQGIEGNLTCAFRNSTVSAKYTLEIYQAMDDLL